MTYINLKFNINENYSLRKLTWRLMNNINSIKYWLIKLAYKSPIMIKNF